MRQKSDADLVALARAGDKAAFGVLIERYQPMVQHIALKIVLYEDLAKELAQEAMLQAYLSLADLREATRFKNWLYGITLNVCKSYLRNQKIDFYSLETLMGGMRFDGDVFAEVAPDPQEIAEARELHQRVLEAVNALSPKNRAATLLFYYDQLSLQEVAAILDVSVGAVKGRLHKARQQLRQQLWPVYAEMSQVAPITERKKAMIKVTVADVVKKKAKDSEDTHDIVILLDEVGRRLLPIWIGPETAEAIIIHLLDHTIVRPMTYTFMANLLAAAGAELEEVRVEALKDETFYGIAKLKRGETVQEVDARPSDAINLALRVGCPIYVTEAVMKQAGADIPEGEALPTGRGLDLIKQEMEEKFEAFKAKQQTREERTEEEKKAETEKNTQEVLALVLGKET